MNEENLKRVIHESPVHGPLLVAELQRVREIAHMEELERCDPNGTWYDVAQAALARLKLCDDGTPDARGKFRVIEAEANASMLKKALEKAWKLSTWAAAINRHPTQTNTAEWLDGLQERIESFQEDPACAHLTDAMAHGTITSQDIVPKRRP